MIKFGFVSRALDNAINDNGILKDENGMLRLPERATKNAAGYDFFNLEEVSIEPGEIKYVKTGVKAEMPDYLVLLLFNRSSNPKKKGLILANGVGVVDADYYNNPDNEGEIAFAFQNITNLPVTLVKGEKLGQGIFVKWYKVENEAEVETTREGGFGSTGV